MSKNSIESLEKSRQRIGIGFAMTELSSVIAKKTVQSSL